MRKLFYSLAIFFGVLASVFSIQESFAMIPGGYLIEEAYGKSKFLSFTLITVIGMAVVFVIMLIVFRKTIKIKSYNMKLDFPTILGLASVSILCIFAISMGIYDESKVSMGNSSYPFAKAKQVSYNQTVDERAFSLTLSVSAPGTHPLMLKIHDIDDVWFYFGETIPDYRFAYTMDKGTFLQLQDQIFETSFFDLEDEYFPVSEPKSKQVYKIVVITEDNTKSVQWKPNTMVPQDLVNLYSLLMEIKDDYATSLIVH